MKYENLKPFGTLALYVDSIYYFQDQIKEDIRILIPDGKTDMVFTLDDHEKYICYPKKSPIPLRQSLIMGPHKKAVLYKYEEEISIIGVRLYPSALKKLFNISAIELSDEPKLLESFLGNEANVLLRKIEDTESITHKLTIVESWLTSRLPEHASEPDSMHQFVLRIYKTKGIEPLESICNYSYNEYKKLQRVFSKELGITPKFFARMVRFEAVHNEIMALKKIDWLTLVHTYGFHDQSHLIKEFKFFTGETPKDFLARLNIFI